jgi:IS5 family transposase
VKTTALNIARTTLLHKESNMKTTEKVIHILNTQLATVEGSIAEGNMSNERRDSLVSSANSLLSFAKTTEMLTLPDYLEWTKRITNARNYATMRQLQKMQEEVSRNETPSWMTGHPVEMD